VSATPRRHGIFDETATRALRSSFSCLDGHALSSLASRAGLEFVPSYLVAYFAGVDVKRRDSRLAPAARPDGTAGVVVAASQRPYGTSSCLGIPLVSERSANVRELRSSSS
jgi:hypothetical protein